MTSPSLRTAIEWIADNDATAGLELDALAGQVSILLIADLFDLAPRLVAERVLEQRQRLAA